MKKKFLSLMMAAAVVATTSVSAFADTTIGGVTYPDTFNVDGSDNTDAIAPVQINGNIQDDSGNDAAGTFKVTVPTSANFTVNKNGLLMGPTMTIKNEGSQKIQVLAQNFSSGTGAIKIISEKKIKDDKDRGTDAQEYSRDTISLKLMGEFENGTQKVAYLGASDAGHGVYQDADLGRVANDGVSLLTLEPGNSKATTGTIEIQGSAGSKKGIQSGVSDNFTLTLRIKKVVNP